jgi:hypothetical protein
MFPCFSGLDSTSSLSVLKSLRAVAEEGKLTVLCVIHQPRFEIFSKWYGFVIICERKMAVQGERFIRKHNLEILLMVSPYIHITVSFLRWLGSSTWKCYSSILFIHLYWMCWTDTVTEPVVLYIIPCDFSILCHEVEPYRCSSLFFGWTSPIPLRAWM